MAIRKRISSKTGKVSWQIDYFDPTGKRIRKSFKKRKDAEAELGKRFSLIAENRYLDIKKDYKSTLTELLDKYTEDYQHQSSFKNAKHKYLENFKEFFGEDTLLANIGYVDVETYRNHLKGKPVSVKKKGKQVIVGLRKDSSINREMSCLHHVFTKGVEWDMAEKALLTRANH